MTPARAFAFGKALWRAYGVRGSIARAVHEIRKKAGLYRATPQPVSAGAEQSKLPANWPFVVNFELVRAATNRAEALARADRVLGGEHQAYRWTWTALPRNAVEWRTHPITHYEHGIDEPWFRIAHYNDEAGDVKDVWEPARFAWAYDLMRGFMLTGNDAYARKFWEATEAFLDGNPPFMGLQWSCGQETSIRAIAWLWAESIFASAPSSTAERMTRLRRALVWSGERVQDALTYAVIQRNNHGISEVAGLAVLGARFLDSDPRARGWLTRANRLLTEQILDQFLEDGWYLQHSFNYARLALDQVTVAQRALRARGLGLSAEACARIREAVHLLADLTDEATGRLPLHGPNDGAYGLPLSTGRYEDFRPALTAAAVTSGAPLPGNVPADAETLAWLGALRPIVVPRRPGAMVRSGSSGWALARTGDALLFTRAGRYESRPSHIDPLHVDLWVAGQPVAIDAGTYRYWDEPLWSNGLAIPEVHNTVTIKGLPLAKRGPRYLWVSWPRAYIKSATERAGIVRIEAINDSWREHGIEHRRTCEFSEAQLTVTDILKAPRTFVGEATVQWLLDVHPSTIYIKGSRPLTTSVRHGEPQSLFGWQSEGYGVRRVVSSLRSTAVLQDGELRFVTTFDLVALRSARVAEAERADIVATIS